MQKKATTELRPYYTASMWHSNYHKSLFIIIKIIIIIINTSEPRDELKWWLRWTWYSILQCWQDSRNRWAKCEMHGGQERGPAGKTSIEFRRHFFTGDRRPESARNSSWLVRVDLPAGDRRYDTNESRTRTRGKTWTNLDGIPSSNCRRWPKFFLM